MSSFGITQTIKPPTYDRLLGKDITRLPDMKKVSRDIFVTNNKPLTPDEKRRSFAKKAFTVATFALTGLYLAHRNNLFNPIKREAKKIIRNEDFQKKILAYVDGKISDDTYTNATKQFLNKMLGEKRTPAFITETKKILSDKESFDELFIKIKKRLADDKNPETLKQGFAVDVLDKLMVKIERDLVTNKDNGLPYKGQSDKIIKDIFSIPAKGHSIVEELLFDSINNRTSSTIEKHINNQVLQKYKNV